MSNNNWFVFRYENNTHPASLNDFFWALRIIRSRSGLANDIICTSLRKQDASGTTLIVFSMV
jgi:hypothetical protein